MNLTTQINSALKTIKDPELGLDMLTLGLIYEIKENQGEVKVTMTLTFPGCPWGPELLEKVKKVIKATPGVKKVTVDLTFDPPWDISMIDPDARLSLGLR